LSTDKGPLRIVGNTHAQDRSLNVELIDQKTNMWCWAASTEMITKFLGAKR